MTQVFEGAIKKEILEKAEVIAIVGLSNDPLRPSYRIGKYLQSQGYQIVPVNPKLADFFGVKAYPDLTSIPFKVDLVDVFRRSDEVYDVIQQAKDLNIPTVWLQLGINCPEEGLDLAKENDLNLVQNCCIMVDHRNLIGSRN